MGTDIPAKKQPGLLRDLLTLMKARITVATTVTTGAGYILATGELRGEMWMPLLGTFLLASGSSALNQCQEVEIDSRMPRTRNRPLPAGRLSLATGLFLSGLMILLGLYVLASLERNTLLLLGLGGFAVLWYNGVYVYLKRLTAFAAVPGALVGALPPLIGWTAGGGDPGDPLILLLAAFFFIWQIPHFWLLLLMQGDEYELAGLPTLTAVFSPRQLFRITFMWVLATAVAGIVLPAIARQAVPWYWGVAMAAASVWLAMKAMVLLRPPATDQRPTFVRSFIQINVYALLITICLSLAALASNTGHM
jgi:protoheme IX farnesyltransferase